MLHRAIEQTLMIDDLRGKETVRTSVKSSYSHDHLPWHRRRSSSTGHRQQKGSNDDDVVNTYASQIKASELGCAARFNNAPDSLLDVALL